MMLTAVAIPLLFLVHDLDSLVRVKVVDHIQKYLAQQVILKEEAEQIFLKISEVRMRRLWKSKVKYVIFFSF